MMMMMIIIIIINVPMIVASLNTPVDYRIYHLSVRQKSTHALWFPSRDLVVRDTKSGSLLDKKQTESNRIRRHVDSHVT